MSNHGQIAQARRDFLNSIKFNLPAPNQGISYYYKKDQILTDGTPVADILAVKDDHFLIAPIKHFNFYTYYFTDLQFLPGISKKDFMAGCSFMYSGHFQTLTRYSLHYDAKDDQLKDDTAGFEFDIVTIQPEGFKFYASGTVITINFNECEMKEVTNG